MNNMTLITAGSSPDAYRLQRVVNIKEVVFGDQQELPAIPGKIQVVLPPVSSGTFSHQMLRVCLDLGIKTVYPLKRDEIVELSLARQLFYEYGVKLMIPSERCLNAGGYASSGREEMFVVDEGRLVGGNHPGDLDILSGETGVFSAGKNGDQILFRIFTV